MNTSTKILLGLLILVFAIPGLLAMTLSNKVSNKEYVVQKSEGMNKIPMTEGNIAAYKAVKVEGPQTESFTVYLTHSDTAHYKFRNDNADDSVSVSVVNDTLLVRYQPKSKSNGQDNFNFQRVELQLPQLQSLYVDGAAVLLDSTLSNGTISATLKNDAIIRQKKPRDESMNLPVAPKASQTATVTVETSESITISNKEEVKEMIEKNMPGQREVKDVVIFHLM